jgi:predicted TIM-barrel fold metal-dependent hydrolase
MVAYNRWLLDHCSADRSRLTPIAQTLLADPSEAERDLTTLRDQGYEHVMLPWTLPQQPDFFSLQYERLWRAIEDLGLTLHLHKVAIPDYLRGSAAAAASGVGSFFRHVNETLPGQLCLTRIFDARIPDHCPRLRFAIHECGAGWLPAWLARAEESYDTISPSPTRLTHNPSHYIFDRDTLFFGMSLSESAELVRAVVTRVMVATDFPHPGCAVDAGSKWRAHLSALTSEERQALLVANAQRLIGTN